MLKEFGTDTTCSHMSFSERHIKMAITYKKQEYVWLTRLEIVLLFKGHVWQPGKDHAEKIISKAKGKQKTPSLPEG